MMRAHALIFLGPPGAGKGTQARMASKHFSIPQISTGDILRTAVKNKTAIGMIAKLRMDAGELLPDEVVCSLVEDRIHKPDCGNGFILDGFPRTISQAQFVNGVLAAKRNFGTVAFNIEVTEAEILKRINGRRTCSVCGEIYNDHFNPSSKSGVCDKDGGALFHRDDDNVASFHKRLDEYHGQTAPLINYFRKRGELVSFDGTKQPAEIAAELQYYLGREQYLRHPAFTVERARA